MEVCRHYYTHTHTHIHLQTNTLKTCCPSAIRAVKLQKLNQRDIQDLRALQVSKYHDNTPANHHKTMVDEVLL